MKGNKMGNLPKLYQIHHQDKKDFSCEMVSQNEINTHEEMQEWQKDVAESHPLPEGKQWLICNEKSRHFVMAADPPVYHEVEE